MKGSPTLPATLLFNHLPADLQHKPIAGKDVVLLTVVASASRLVSGTRDIFGKYVT